MDSKRKQLSIAIEETTDESITVVLSGADRDIVNGIRRSVLNDVDKLAISIVSQMPDPTGTDFEAVPPDLVDRMRGLPVLSDCVYAGEHAPMIRRSDCPCGGVTGHDGLFVCKRCSVQFYVQKSNPVGAEVPLTVYGRDVICVSGHDSRITAPDLVVWKLMPGQSLNILMTAEVLCGLVNVAYCPATIVSVHELNCVRVVPDIEALMTPRQRLATVRQCQTGTLGFALDTQTIVVRDEPSCTACGKCTSFEQEVRPRGRAPRTVTPMRVARHPSMTSRLCIETDGTLAPATVLQQAFVQIKRRLSTCAVHTKVLADDARAREFSPEV